MELYALWVAWLDLAMIWAPDKGRALNYLALFLLLGILAIATASAGVSDRRFRFLLVTLAGQLRRQRESGHAQADGGTQQQAAAERRWHPCVLAALAVAVELRDPLAQRARCPAARPTAVA